MLEGRSLNLDAPGAREFAQGLPGDTIRKPTSYTGLDNYNKAAKYIKYDHIKCIHAQRLKGTPQTVLA